MKLSVATLLHKPAICCNITHSQDRSGEDLTFAAKLEIYVLRQEAEGKRKKEGARRSVFTNMRWSPGQCHIPTIKSIILGLENGAVSSIAVLSIVISKSRAMASGPRPCYGQFNHPIRLILTVTHRIRYRRVHSHQKSTDQLENLAATHPTRDSQSILDFRF